MGNLFAELKRRHIYRVAAAYAVVAWIVLQIVNNVAPAFNLPGSAVMLVIVLLTAGFPIALIFAWVLELKSPNAPTKTSAMDWALVAVAMAFVGMFAYQQFAPSRATITAQSDIEAARDAAAKPAGISLAVLPFVNLSSDKEQEFFSDGMTEEITSALAKVPDLRVVARTSAFEFKGKNVGIESIGQQLHATHLIEGSVRKADDRVRITVQLIKTDDGTHIWAEDYDRQLTDIFQIQEDIARAIATSLRMPLGLKPGENLVNNRNIDTLSYEKFLRAKALYDGRGNGGDVVKANTEAESLLKEVMAKNPNFAPAGVMLGGVYLNFANFHAANANESIIESRAQVDEFRTKGEAIARKVVQGDPGLAEGYALLATFVWSRGKLVEAEDIYLKALSLDAAFVPLLDGYTIRIGATGRLKDALSSIEKAHALEPFLPAIITRTVEALWLNGQNEAAIELAKTLRPNARAVALARIYASMSRYGEAADALMEIASDPNSDAAKAANLLRTAPAATVASEKLPRLPQNLEFIYLYVGAPERAIATYERRADVGFLGTNGPAWVWHLSYAPVRKTERFNALMRKVGLVDYWRAKGWPPQCHPTTGDDFECS